MYLSTSSCTLCKDRINSKVKYNLKSSTAEKSNMPLISFVEAFNKNIIFSHCNICANCHDLLNELDVLQQREKEILSMLKAYVLSKEGKTDSPNDTIIEPKTNMLFIKEEFEEVELPDLDLKKLPIKIKRVMSSNKHRTTSKNSSKSVETKNIDCFDEYLCDRVPREDDVAETKDALLFERIQHFIKEDLSKHAAEKQNKAKPSSALCEICGQNFKSKIGYEKHMKKHNTVDDDLKLLKLNKHEDDEYQCPICKKEFSQKISKRRHMAIHTGKTRYQCEHCGKEFIHHSSFTMHMKIHSGIRNYKCDLCNRLFLNSSHLKRHMRSLHFREKRYACSTCGKKFGEKYNLDAHIRVLHKELQGPIENYIEEVQGTEEVEVTEEEPISDETEEATVIYQMQEDGTFLSGVALLKNTELLNTVVVSDANVLYTL